MKITKDNQIKQRYFKSPRIVMVGISSLTLLATILTPTISASASTYNGVDTFEVGQGQLYTTIQAGVNAAGDADIIHVHAGTYPENVVIDGKYVTLQGDAGAIIHPLNNSGKGVITILNVPYITVPLTMRAKVTGFIIENGDAPSGQGGGFTIALNANAEIYGNIIQNNRASDYGGGISIHTGSNPIIRDNIIRGNYAKQGGSGIFAVDNSSPIIYGNTISGNTTSGATIPNGGSSGGGIYLENTGDANAHSYPVVLKNTIINNNADFAGGGMMLRTGVNAIIEGNTISGNTSSYGGGIHVETTGSTVVIASNTISGNAATANANFSGSGFGGGIALYDHSNVTIRSNTIKGNTASSGGAGISSAEGAVAQINNNNIIGNINDIGRPGNQEGGGLYVANSTITAINNQFISNTGDIGGAIALLNGASATILNNTIAKNSEPYDHGGAIFVLTQATSSYINNNILTQNQGFQIFKQSAAGDVRNNLLTAPSSVSGSGTSGLFYSPDGFNERSAAAQINANVPNASGNIDTNPGFTNLAGDDYSLTSTSTAINSAAPSTSVTEDYRGAIRDAFPLDIGAFEYETNPIIKNSVFRFWSDSKKGHFYTIDPAERDTVASTYSPSEWRYEYVAYNAFSTQIAGTVPLYRFYSQQFQGHFYTANLSEKDYVIATYPETVWKYEGVGYYVYPLDSTVASLAVYRFWSPDNKHHFYTASQAESNYVQATYPTHVWSYEGSVFRVPQ